MYPNASVVNLSNALTDFLGDGTHTINVVSYSLKWSKVYYGSLSAEGSRLLSAFEDAKAALSVQSGVLITKKIVRRVYNFQKETLVGFTKEIFFDGIDVIGYARNLVRFINYHQLYPVSEGVLQNVNYLGGISSFLGPGRKTFFSFNQLIEGIKKIGGPGYTEEEILIQKARVVDQFAKTVVATSYAISGAVITASILFKMSYVNWVPLVLSTNALLFTLGGSLHQKLSVLSKNS